MRWKTAPEMLLAPPASNGAAMKFPGASAFPPVDEHLVKPETREELVRGRRVEALPAREPHGDRHFELDYLLGGNLREGYVGSTDLLTRSSERSNFATDTCIRRAGIDPATNARYLEEVAFEVVHEQSLRDITERADDLSARGVRRVFAIFVKKGEVKEWAPAEKAWRALDLRGTLEDPCLLQPVRVRALLDAAEADDAVARGLIARKNPVLVSALDEARQEGTRRGKQEGNREGEERGVRAGKAASLIAVLAARGLAVSEEAAATIRAADGAALDAWLPRAVTCASVEDLLADRG